MSELKEPINTQPIYNTETINNFTKFTDTKNALHKHKTVTTNRARNCRSMT